MSSNRAPKQWCLSKNETLTSFESWKKNLLYTLSLDANFAPFLGEGSSWLKKTRASPLRGYTDDGETVPAARRRTAVQKVTMLELMLGQIANYCPIISRNTIVKNSTCIGDIWQTIRLRFGFQTTGGHFLDLDDIHLNPDERPEDLFQCLMAFVEDSLIKPHTLSHHGSVLEEEEELSPTLENFVILTWLRLINPALPKLVKQRYGTELRSRTLASLKPEISQALDSLFDEIRSAEDTKVMRTGASFATQKSSFRRGTPIFSKSSVRFPGRSSPKAKECPLCKQAGRASHSHFLSECGFLPEQDRLYLLKARQIVSILDDDSAELDFPSSDVDPPRLQNLVEQSDSFTSDASRRFLVRQSPYIDTFFSHHPARVIIDSGATGNMIRLSAVQRLGAEIRHSSQSAHQADGSSPFKVLGETRLSLTRGSHSFQFEGLVVENLDVDVLAGTPFMETNDITIRPAKRQVILGDGTIFTYGSVNPPPTHNAVRRAQVLRAPSSSTTVWPGDFIEIVLPEDSLPDAEYALEPRFDATNARSAKVADMWPPPCLITSVAGRVRIPNLSDRPYVLKRNEHFCQVNPIFFPSIQDPPSNLVGDLPSHKVCSVPVSERKYSQGVALDPDNLLPPVITTKFRNLLAQYDFVFDPAITCYNGAFGPLQAKVNMGPVEPPQRKGRLPLYARDKLVELQQKFDELENFGVFRRPEDIDLSVEYLNPSFLVKKSSGGFRLVTDFADVGRYSKPQPSLLPDVDSTQRCIAQWRHIIVSDLTSAFYQIPLARESMKYCGVATPFRGVRVYARSAMGIPGSETALEELLCRVLGDLLQAGIVAKIPDDLYCGGNSPDELLRNWSSVLRALHKANLRLSAAKTIINPKTTSVLGWTWSQGTLCASPHRVSTLSSCSPPNKVGGMKSFIGAVKVLAHVVPHCSALLAPLDEAVAGKQSQDDIVWSDHLTEVFKSAQAALASCHTITLPKPDNQLWIVTDAAVKRPGIAATLYISRGDKLALAGFFSAKLRSHQLSWLPCEVEALAIGVAVKHFSPYIIQSKHKACVLTDSKPCVQAFEKMCRGEFSASPRVSTYLSTVSRFQANVRHVAGAAILSSDFASRNAPVCSDSSCQVCKFINQAEESVVRHLSAQDVLSGQENLPFTSRKTWLSIQSECADLRRTHAHLIQGTRPSKKLTNIKDVKRYLSVTSISSDGLLVVKKTEPLAPSRDCIVVPRQVLDGLLTALHLRLSHPSCLQLKKVFSRYFYALDMDKAIERVSLGCHSCAALRHAPHTVIDQSTSDPPAAVGVSFAADILKQSPQLILVLRECVTSYTSTLLVVDEKHGTLRDGLIQLCVGLRPLDGPNAVIRCDPAPAFRALVNDQLLLQHKISLEIGRVKNQNKNPVAERAIQELEHELLRLQPEDGTVSPRTLSVATAHLNSRIRSRSLSSREMWTQRDQFTNSQVPLTDQALIREQHLQRLVNHPHSETSKAPRGALRSSPSITVGDLVYLYCDRNKSRGRDRYLVVLVDGEWCNVRKFVGSQLRNVSYRVKKSECYKVAPFRVHTPWCPSEEESSDCDPDVGVDQSPPTDGRGLPIDEEPSPESGPLPPPAPEVPIEISSPPSALAPAEDVPKYGEDSQPGLLDDVEVIPAPSPSVSPAVNERPTRQRRLPQRLQDYVVELK